MKIWKGILGASALSLAALAVASTTSEQPVVLTAESVPPPGSGAQFSCGAFCDGVWHHVAYCYEPQTCCGYIYCSSGVSQNICCPSGTTCNYDLGQEPPAAARCIGSGGGPQQ